MKKCPFCAEEIQDQAIICRYCHSRLDGAPSAIPPANDTETTQEPFTNDTNGASWYDVSTPEGKLSAHGTSTAAMVLGILGGALAVLSAIISAMTAGFVTAIGSAFSDTITETDVASSTAIFMVLGLIAAYMAIFGGIFAKRLPIVSGLLQIFACIMGNISFFTTLNFFGVATTILMLIGGIIAFAQKKEYVNYKDPNCPYRWSKGKMIAAAIVAAILFISLFMVGGSFSAADNGSDTSVSAENAVALEDTNTQNQEETKSITVPNFVGMSGEEVTEEYRHTFALEVKRYFNNDYDKGFIYYQDPSSGSSVEPKSKVTIYVSDGINPAATTKATTAATTKATTATTVASDNVEKTDTITELTPEKEFSNWVSQSPLFYNGGCFFHLYQNYSSDYPENNPEIYIKADGTFSFNCNRLYAMNTYYGTWECVEIDNIVKFKLSVETLSNGEPIPDYIDIYNSKIYLTWNVGSDTVVFQDSFPEGEAYFGASQDGTVFSVIEYLY